MTRCVFFLICILSVYGLFIVRILAQVSQTEAEKAKEQLALSGMHGCLDRCSSCGLRKGAKSAEGAVMRSGKRNGDRGRYGANARASTAVVSDSSASCGVGNLLRALFAR